MGRERRGGREERGVSDGGDGSGEKGVPSAWCAGRGRAARATRARASDRGAIVERTKANAASRARAASAGGDISDASGAVRAGGGAGYGAARGSRRALEPSGLVPGASPAGAGGNEANERRGGDRSRIRRRVPIALKSREPSARGAERARGTLAVASRKKPARARPRRGGRNREGGHAHRDSSRPAVVRRGWLCPGRQPAKLYRTSSVRTLMRSWASSIHKTREGPFVFVLGARSRESVRARSPAATSTGDLSRRSNPLALAPRPSRVSDRRFHAPEAPSARVSDPPASIAHPLRSSVRVVSAS